MDHFQGTVPGCLDHLPLLTTGCIKAVDRGDLLVETKRRNPSLFTILRHWNDAMQHYDGNTDMDVWIGRAWDWFKSFVDGTFLDQYAPYIDAVSWHNEIWANSQNEHERLERIVGTAAALKVWNNEYRSDPRLAHIRLVIGEAAVGNWMPKSVVQMAIENDALMGYHPYSAYGWDGLYRQRWPNDWTSLSGLWDVMEYNYGVKPTWVFTECGPYSGPVTGWRSSEVCGGDLNLYVEAVRAWIKDIQQTPAYREGRILGFNLFTTGRVDSRWKNFETDTDQLNALAEMYRDEWHPGTYNPPPPPPADDWRHQLWDESVRRQTVSMNSEALVQKEIMLDGYNVVESEFRFTDGAGAQYAAQAAEPIGGGARRVYFTRVPDPGQPWQKPQWFTDPRSVPINVIVDDLETNPESQWYPYATRPVENIDTVVIHHSVSLADPYLVAHIHCQSKGWPGIGYHFYIDIEGTIYQTNWYKTLSYHANYANPYSIGVCLEGDFRYRKLTGAQRDSLLLLLGVLVADLPNLSILIGHREAPGSSTVCPGMSDADLDQLKREL